MTLRIAMVAACPYPVPQGSQVLLRTTAEALKRRGHDVHVLVYGYGDGTDDGTLTIHRCSRIPGMHRTLAGPSWGKPLADVALVRTLRRVIHEHDIDIVHAHNYEGLIVALACGKRPIVYHAHNAMSDELPYFMPGGRVFGRWLDLTLPRRADRVIALHDRLAQYLVECGCSPRQVDVIPPSVDPDAFEIGAVSAGIPPILYTGNLDAYQNLPLLLRAMTRVRAAVPNARLQIATADPRPVPDAEMIPAPDFESLRKVLRDDVIVVCPRTSWSGYPIKILNAMAAAKPVVACSSASPCLLNEHNGLVVPDNNDAVMADAIRRLIDDPNLRARLGRAARETARIDFNSETIGKRIEDVYHAALKTT
jgi:glycosyltransferase involved in cell wall biosynthesis